MLSRPSSWILSPITGSSSITIAGLAVVRIPRCVKPNVLGDCYLELHHFSDASERAYGSCSYLRCVSRTGAIHVAFLISKGKVAPIKTLSIPRLELEGAVLSAQFDSMLRNELELDITKSYFWTDSKIVLQYINLQVFDLETSGCTSTSRSCH